MAFRRQIFIRAIQGGALASFIVLIPVLVVRQAPQSIFADGIESALYAIIIATSTCYFALCRRPVAPVKSIEESQSEIPIVRVLGEVSIPAVAVETSLLRKRFRLSGLFSAVSKRTVRIAFCSYLLLYIECSVLCRKLSFGDLVLGEFEIATARACGLIFVITGSLIILVGSMRRWRLAGSERFTETTSDENEIVVSDLVPVATKLPLNSARKLANSFEAYGLIFMLVGIPLIFSAWLPLLAIPGIIIVLDWLYKSGGTSTGAIDKIESEDIGYSH